MSSRRPTQATPVSALEDPLEGFFRLELADRASPATTDAPLSNQTSTARRSDPDHVRGIAVLAYTNMWDGFINHHVRGHRDYLRPFGADRAIQYAGVLAFFAPLEDLQRLFPADVTSVASITLTLRGPLPLARPPACSLRLSIAGLDAAGSQGVARLIGERIVEPAGRGDAVALRIWHAAVQRIVLELDGATTQTVSGGIFSNTPVYRGMRMLAWSSPSDVLTEMSTAFVSTSNSLGVADHFSGNGSAAGERRWILKITVGPGVRIIDVEKSLPSRWTCHSESEIVIAPGAYYTLTSVAPRGAEIRRIRVRVTSAPDAAPPAPPPAPAPPPPPAPISAEEATRLLANAVLANDLAAVTTLIGAGADINSEQDRSSMLAIASFGGYDPIVTTLLGAGASVNAVDSSGYTALMAACRNGRRGTVNLLLAAGAEVNTASPSTGSTALMYAAGHGRQVDGAATAVPAGSVAAEIVGILIAAGANIEQRTKKGRTALAIAAYWGNAQTTKALIDAGADVNTASYETKLTPLMLASERGFGRVVEALLEAGADVWLDNKRGRRAADLAKARGHDEVVDILQLAMIRWRLGA